MANLGPEFEFNAQPFVDCFRRALMIRIGGYKSPTHRMIEPEIDAFLEYDVPEIINAVAIKAEQPHAFRRAREADQASRNMLEAVFAGVELAERSATKQNADSHHRCDRMDCESCGKHKE
jgi:hypothetical protein